MSYTVPAGTRIGHIHLKVSDLERSLKFYRDLLGFELQQYFGDSAAFISAGGYHHHIGLNTWHSKNAGPPRSKQQVCITLLYYIQREKILLSY
jgi:catechol 2,3-dioxygenase